MSAISKRISVEPRGHAVHFYESTAELAGIVGGYLAEGLGAGGAAVVVATPPHIEAFKQELAFHGVDVWAYAQARGTLVVLDAAETLAHLIRDGEIDPEAFQRVVGTLLRDLAAGGRAVRAHGEMVDLLWQSGNVDAAIELEKLWNELLQELGFSLLCGYHSEAVEAPEHLHELDQVCRLHSSVSKAPAPERKLIHRLSREFEPSPGAPQAARRFVEEALRGWGHGDTVIDDARLLLSELVTNAVTHARSPVSVTLRARGSALRLAVRDESPAEPTPRPVAPEADAGRGLQIVAALAKEWGVLATRGGKTVWAEL
jgi:anti-sigma regulatory factor (Ser/Thr protein kinase)